ncbi:MAG: excinuclease ABC subunit UvrC [Acidobacteriales bacterium]|nr:excinuclease ABC subunit UvrC [Terriglobales bacterium]
MDLHEKIKTLPTRPGVYLYKDADGAVIYVGKAKSLRARVRSYFLRTAQEDAKTGSLIREAVDVDYIVVDNEREALALENNLIKQKQPRYNILLRDDKTYPYIKLTVADRHPKVFVTRRLRRDGSLYFGPYFPGNLAHRLVDLIHRCFMIPSCKLDLNKYYPRPCLQYYIKRCLAPCVKELVAPEAYREAVRDVQLFLEGKQGELERILSERMGRASEDLNFEAAARFRDLISTVRDAQERQRIASAENDDADVFGFHYENDMLAVNLFHLRGGKIVDRREFFWEDLPDFGMETESGAPAFSPAEFFSALLKQVYIDQPYIPGTILVPVDFEDREALSELLSEKRGRKVSIDVPQRGEKRSMLDLAALNAKQCYDQRFRVMKPQKQQLAAALQEALNLPEPPRRIECFDISHIQGAETVASMVVWEDGGMKKSDYRKFIIRSVAGVDDFASMHEVITRRYRRVAAEHSESGSKMPSLVLVDGGLGQLSAAAEALDTLSLGSQPLAAIAKREEVIYLRGEENDPVVLDRHSPVLHVIQMIRDESHRFAVTFHRKRREIRDRVSELEEITGIGAIARRRLLTHFGSLRAVKEADEVALSAVVNRKQAQAVWSHFHQPEIADRAGALEQ